MMNIKISKWLCFNVMFSAIPLILVIFINYTIEQKVGELDYIPDLILVSFAVAVNIINCVCDKNTKDDINVVHCMISSIITMVTCTALYYFLMSYAVELSELITRLEKVTEEDTELLREAVSDINNFFVQKIGKVRWPIYKCTTLLLLFVNVILGVRMEAKQFSKEEVEKKNSEDYEYLVNVLRHLLERKKAELPQRDYERIKVEIEQYLKEKK